MPKKWQGINTRVKNITIEPNTYFGYEEDTAAKVRIGGELYIDNIDENNAIQSNRSGFAIENNDYLLISKYMLEQIRITVRKVRKHTDVDSAVKKTVNKLEKLNDLFGKISIIEDKKPDAEDFKQLDDKENDISDFEQYSLEDNIKDELDKIDVDFDMIWSVILQGSYYVEYEEDDFYSIYINEELKEMSFDVSGNTVQYLIGYCGDDKPLVIKKPGKLYLNLDNELIADRDISKIDIGFIRVVVIMYLNYLKCNNNAEFLYTESIKDLSI